MTNTANEIGIGMLGYAFMGKAHSNAFRKLPYIAWPPPLVPRLVAIAGRNEEAVSDAARRYGYDRWTTDWRDIVADERIGLFDNGGPNSLHAEPTIAAAEAGKHVLCEKPLGRTADESYEIWRRVAATGVKHLCGFNYRFVPAVRLGRRLIEEGALGELRHFRGRYLQDWGDGSEGSLYFDMERMNELQVFRGDDERTRGFRTVLVTEASHPFMEFWWPPGHIVGWGDTFMHEAHHLLQAIATDGDVAPYGATFEDGYRASEIADAIVRSSESGRRETVEFRML